MEADNFLRIGNSGFVHEAGIVKIGRNEFLNDAIRAVEGAGGEVRSVQTLVSIHLIPRLGGESYFRVTAEGVPILGVERGASIATIAHELAHFKDWLRFRDEFIAEGVEAKKAALKAKSKLSESGPKMTRFTEENAVAAERAVSKSDFRDPDFIRRSVYPEVAAVSKMKSRKRALNSRKKAEINALLDNAIAKAVAIRRMRASSFKEELLKQGLAPRQTQAIQIQIDAANDLRTLTAELFPESEWEKIAGKQGFTGSEDFNIRKMFEQRLIMFLGETDHRIAE